MDSITSALPGTINFLRLEGEPEPPRVVLDEIPPQPGVNGRFFRVLGVRSREYVLRGVTDVSNPLAAGTLKQLAEAFVGTFCTISIHGVTWSNHLCLDARPAETIPFLSGVGGFSSGGSQKFLVGLEFVFVYGGT